MPLQAQALAALGAAGVDNGAAATGLHANEKAVRTRAAHFGRLVGAFHDRYSGKPMIILEKQALGQAAAIRGYRVPEFLSKPDSSRSGWTSSPKGLCGQLAGNLESAAFRKRQYPQRQLPNE
jgi:hypothetical protein